MLIFNKESIFDSALDEDIDWEELEQQFEIMPLGRSFEVVASIEWLGRDKPLPFDLEDVGEEND